MKSWVGWGLLLITAGALALRVPNLGLRPMHNDEAVNAIKIEGLWQHGQYRYDPDEHHGPTLYYATLPFVWLSGAQDFDHLSEGALRAVSVFFGLSLIVLLWLVADGLGPGATLVAGVLTALSPAMVFYSRYFIHELLLVSFTLLLIASGWRYSRQPRLGWALLAGASLGLMYATKETFVIALAALAGAAVGTAAWSRWTEGKPLRQDWKWNWRHGLAALLVAAFVALLFFTSFFTNARGPLDSLRTYTPWIKRAEGASPHIHPWFFYLQRLVFFKEFKGPVWSEGLILILGAVGLGAALMRNALPEPRRGLVRFLGFYTVLLTAAYSVIAYKTPWCLLGFWNSMILLAGVGAAVLFEASRNVAWRVGLSVLLVAGMTHLGWEAWRASFTMCADRTNPYVYAQTVPDVLKLVEKVEALAKVAPQGKETVVKVMAPDSDYWPLPWYLRDFKHVGWWGRVPKDPFAPIVIAGAKLHAALDDKSDRAWLMVGYFELRPKTFLELYVNFDLWKKYVESRPRSE